MEVLLAHGADVNVKSYDGETPLHLAVKNGHEDAAALLRQHGATE
jgi:ankyrin repeat protein